MPSVGPASATCHRRSPARGTAAALSIRRHVAWGLAAVLAALVAVAVLSDAAVPPCLAVLRTPPTGPVPPSHAHWPGPRLDSDLLSTTALQPLGGLAGVPGPSTALPGRPPAAPAPPPVLPGALPPIADTAPATARASADPSALTIWFASAAYLLGVCTVAVLRGRRPAAQLPPRSPPLLYVAMASVAGEQPPPPCADRHIDARLQVATALVQEVQDRVRAILVELRAREEAAALPRARCPAPCAPGSSPGSGLALLVWLEHAKTCCRRALRLLRRLRGRGRRRGWGMAVGGPGGCGMAAIIGYAPRHTHEDVDTGMRKATWMVREARDRVRTVAMNIPSKVRAWACCWRMGGGGQAVRARWARAPLRAPCVCFGPFRH